MSTRGVRVVQQEFFSGMLVNTSTTGSLFVIPPKKDVIPIVPCQPTPTNHPQATKSQPTNNLIKTNSPQPTKTQPTNNLIKKNNLQPTKTQPTIVSSSAKTSAGSSAGSSAKRPAKSFDKRHAQLDNLSKKRKRDLSSTCALELGCIEKEHPEISKWYKSGVYKKKPLLILGRVGAGKTRLAEIVMRSLTGLDPEGKGYLYDCALEASDLFSAWLNTTQRGGIGMASYLTSGKNHNLTPGFLLDDIDSFPPEVCSAILKCLTRKSQSFPAPLIITCTACTGFQFKHLNKLKTQCLVITVTPPSSNALVAILLKSVGASSILDCPSHEDGLCRAKRAYTGDVRSAIRTFTDHVVPGDKFQPSAFLTTETLFQSGSIGTLGDSIKQDVGMVKKLIAENYPRRATSLPALSLAADTLAVSDVFANRFLIELETELLFGGLPSICRQFSKSTSRSSWRLQCAPSSFKCKKIEY